MKTKEQLIDELIDLAFAEDIGDGDHTTLCCIPDTAMGKSRLLIKEPGILAGVEIARKIFHRFDPDLKMTVYIEDGTAVKPPAMWLLWSKDAYNHYCKPSVLCSM